MTLLSHLGRRLPATGLLLAAALLLAAPRAHAQIQMRDADRPSAHLGVVTGVGATWIVDSKLLDDPNYLSIQSYRTTPIGFVFGYHFNDRNGFQVELDRVKQGADFQIVEKNNGNNRVGTKNIQLTYWSVPVLFKYTSGTAKPVRFEFHVGPQFNFLSAGLEENRYTANGTLLVVPGKTDLTVNDSPRGATVVANTTTVLAQKQDFRSQTIGAAFGIGVEFRLAGPLYLSSQLRATYSLGDLRGQQWVDAVKATGYHNDRQNAVVSALVGLHYQFIRRAEGHPKDRI